MLSYELALPHLNQSPCFHARLLQSAAHIANKFYVWNADQIAPAPTIHYLYLKSKLILVAYRSLHEPAPAHPHLLLPSLPATQCSPATGGFCSSKAISSSHLRSYTRLTLPQSPRGQPTCPLSAAISLPLRSLPSCPLQNSSLLVLRPSLLLVPSLSPSHLFFLLVLCLCLVNTWI